MCYFVSAHVCDGRYHFDTIWFRTATRPNFAHFSRAHFGFFHVFFLLPFGSCQQISDGWYETYELKTRLNMFTWRFGNGNGDKKQQRLVFYLLLQYYLLYEIFFFGSIVTVKSSLMFEKKKCCFVPIFLLKYFEYEIGFKS